MTIMQMLKQHGYDVARSIAPDGRIVFAGSLSQTSSTAVPVKPHTFHGGETPEPDIDADTARTEWWLEGGALKREQDLVASAFPQFAFLSDSTDLAPAWRGVLDTGKGAFDVIVAHRRDHGLPAAIPSSPMLGRFARGGGRRSRAPHLYDNGLLCIADLDDWDPDEDTIVTAIAWTGAWLACYVEWFYTGRWPYEAYLPAAS